MSSLLGCQTQESAYRMSIKDSLYRDDSLLAINVLQQLNAREKGDSTVGDSGQTVQIQGAIKLLTLTNDLRYPKEENEIEVDTAKVDSSAVETEKTPKTPSVAKAKPKTPSVTSNPSPKSVAPVVSPAAKPVVPPTPAKAVETPKPVTPPPAATPVKQ